MTRPALALLMVAFVLSAILVAAPAPPDWLTPHRDAASRLIGEALSTTHAWQRLAELTDTFGHRLAGSKALDDAIAWAVSEMKKDGLDNVHAEKVMVPHWVRGRESVELVEPGPQQLVMLGLGNSVGTPPEGIKAEAVVVGSFDELDALGTRVAGRIVVYNVPFTNYGETVRYRSTGASRAAALGAVGMLLRSVGQPGLRTTHTGALTYADNAPRIPAAAITYEDADRLQRLQDRGVKLVVRLSMEARMLPDAESANVIAEIVGREHPEEVIVIGGHLDSWDVGTGATDDGGGSIASWEAIRLMKKLGLRPRRTVRAVLFTNEENGLRGGLGYRDQHKAELPNHLLMIEIDGGVFRPRGFGFSGSEAARALVKDISSLLAGIDATAIGSAGGGADIGPSVEAGKIASMSLDVDSSLYFTIHHTMADTIERIEPADLARCVAAIAVMSYVVADMPQRLPR
ncbi:MAG: M20/M25/M40 family metallo-hydrolase [Acidobacteria bacterium]|nr:M20/M25/M40 family metallo-hydrolase [Acidobacteriota bacterium]